MDESSLVPAGLHTGRVELCNVIPPGYNKFSENLRRLTPPALQCAVFCGGARCKYENSKSWPPVHMAIQDVFSHWVTEDILAMARPSTAQIIKKNIITQFQGWGIKSIINLQIPGEHASCGSSLEESGFTYDPNLFMQNNMYYYNFAWKDYGDATMGKLLDMVKVVVFAVQEGKVAIHCHAGLGRTGVLIACYLVYSLRVRANDAIRFVRLKRPNAIQTRGQILCVQQFEHYILPQTIVFEVSCNSSNRKSCSLQSYLKKQQNILHGYEQRTFKYIPKIVFTICERILQLCDCQEDNSPAEIKFIVSNTPFTQWFLSHGTRSIREIEGNMRHSYSWADSLADSSFESSTSSRICGGDSQDSIQDTSEDIKALNDTCASPVVPSCLSTYPGLDDNYIDDVLGDGIQGQDLFDNDCYKEIQSQITLKTVAQTQIVHTVSADDAIKALLCEHETLSEEEKKRLWDYQVDLNNRHTAWQRLKLETNLYILSGLLYEWLETLKNPILDLDDLSQIVVRSSRPQQCLKKLEPCKRYLLEYLLRFVSRLRPMTRESQSLLARRIMATVTQQSVWINRRFFPSGKNFKKLRNGTAGKLNEFFIRIMNLIEEVNTQELDRSMVPSKWRVSNLLQNIGVNNDDNDDQDIVQSSH